MLLPSNTESRPSTQTPTRVVQHPTSIKSALRVVLPQLALGFSDAIHAEPSLRSADNNLSVDPTLFHAAFARAGVSDAEAKALVESSASDAAKLLLTANTDEAVSRGTFGSPTVFVSGAVRPSALDATEEFLVFGSDRFEQLAWSLDETWRGPNPPSQS